MITIDLPKDPVDGYQVKYWRLSLTAHWCYINETVATYHVDTSWEDYQETMETSHHDIRKGADLVDDWMICVDGHPTGRFPGWDGLKGLASQKDIFPSREAAVIEARIRLDEYIVQAEEHVLELKKRKIQVSA